MTYITYNLLLAEDSKIAKRQKKAVICNKYIRKQLRLHVLWRKLSTFQCFNCGRDVSFITEKFLEINTCDGKVRSFVPPNSRKAEIEAPSLDTDKFIAVL